jgi:hypothetical protein
MVQGLSLTPLLLEEAPLLDEVLQVYERFNPPKNPLSLSLSLSLYALTQYLDPVPTLESDPPSHLALSAVP